MKENKSLKITAVSFLGSKIQLRDLLTLSSRHPLDADPPEREHGAVVVDVQEGHLVELLPQNKEDRVQILDALGDEVPPQGSCHLSPTPDMRNGLRREAGRRCGRVIQRKQENTDAAGIEE